MVRSFLLIGEQKALLIDCGVTPDDFLSLIRTVTDLPVMVALTHADVDHICNVEQFQTVHLHNDDAHLVLHRFPSMEDRLAFLNEGDQIDLGGTILEVLHIPGHTHGSIAFLNRAERYLIPGDSVSYTAVYLFGSTRNLPDYMRSLKRLQEMTGFDSLYPSHEEAPIPAAAIGQQLQVCEGILDGSIEPELPTMDHQKQAGAKLYRKGPCSILYAPND